MGEETQQPRQRQRESQMAPMTGDYNKLNASQSTVWKFARPLFDEALEALLSSSIESSPFRVADFGCATGGNSIAPLRHVCQHIVKRWSPQTSKTIIELFLCDLPHNAWTEVSTTVTRETLVVGESTDDGSSSKNNNNNNNNDMDNNVFVNMVGRTFYDVCVPPNSLDLSYSFVAAHWMKSHPTDFTSGLYATDIVHNTDPNLLKSWIDAGTQDFHDFTSARYTELKPGGFFVGVIACPKQNGDKPWSYVGRPIYDALLKKIESPAKLASCILPVCWRSEKDVRDGFDSSKWKIHRCEFHETKDPVREAFERGEMSSLEYGSSVIDSFKAVGHRTCFNALSEQVGNDKANQLLDDAYEASIPVVASDPNKYNLDVSFWYILAQKKK